MILHHNAIGFMVNLKTNYKKEIIDMLFEMLIEEARGMTDDALMEVIHYIRFLKTYSKDSNYVEIIPSLDDKRKIYREPGIYKNKLKISKSFDEALDDFELYL